MENELVKCGVRPKNLLVALRQDQRPGGERGRDGRRTRIGKNDYLCSRFLKKEYGKSYRKQGQRVLFRDLGGG